VRCRYTVPSVRVHDADRLEDDDETMRMLRSLLPPGADVAAELRTLKAAGAASA
jgi:hypothetical protein